MITLLEAAGVPVWGRFLIVGTLIAVAYFVGTLLHTVF